MSVDSYNEYILFARPKGNLGKHLKDYWETVKGDKELNQRFFNEYPPHVSLTSFFTKKEVKKIGLKEALGQAVANVNHKGCDVIFKGKGLVQSKHHYDRIEIQSKCFMAITEQFKKIIKLPENKGGKGIDEPLHITLQLKKFKTESKNQEIQELQKKLMKKIGNDIGEWSICLYKSETKMVKDKPVRKLTLCREIQL